MALEMKQLIPVLGQPHLLSPCQFHSNNLGHRDCALALETTGLFDLGPHGTFESLDRFPTDGPNH